MGLCQFLEFFTVLKVEFISVGILTAIGGLIGAVYVLLWSFFVIASGLDWLASRIIQIF
jgi:hypothetical protein